jgi:phage-related tail protein
VFEVCSREYSKTKDKLANVEKEVEELREQVVAQGEADGESVENLNEKMGALMGGQSSNERKWRDAQFAYANMLKVCVWIGWVHVDTKLCF